MKSLRFFKGLSWLIVLNMLVKPVWLFFIDRQVQNIIGYEEYGKYFAILNLSYVLFFLSDAGISNMLNQRIANHLPVNLTQLLRIKLLLFLSYSILLCFIGWLSGISNWTILVYILVIQVFTSLLIFFRNIVSAHQFFTTDAWLSVIDKFLMILVCGSLLYLPFSESISLVLFLEIQLICTITTVVVSFLFILKKKLFVIAEKEEPLQIFKQVLPFALITLLMSVHYRLDGFLLERIHSNGALEAGIYASAYRLLDACNMVGYLASSFLVAFVARHLKDRDLMQDAIFNTRHVLLFSAIGAVSFVIVFAQWLLQLLYHTDNSYNALIMQLCIASFPAYCLVHVYGSVLTGAGLLNQFIHILFITVAVNIVSNLMLIPAYGALGSCIAALVSQYFCGTSTMFMATKKLNISYSGQSMFVYLVTAILLTALFYFGKHALVNVWIILGIAVGFSLFLLTTQLSFFKKSFISLRQ